jgi:hypothetical protein
MWQFRRVAVSQTIGLGSPVLSPASLHPLRILALSAPSAASSRQPPQRFRRKQDRAGLEVLDSRLETVQHNLNKYMLRTSFHYSIAFVFTVNLSGVYINVEPRLKFRREDVA